MPRVAHASNRGAAASLLLAWTIALLVLLLIVGSAPPMGLRARSLAATLPTAHDGGGVPQPLQSCGTPAAIVIDAPEPTGSVATGDRLSVVYEVEIAKYTTADGALNVYLPRTTAVFPLSGGSSLNLSLPPHELTGVAGSWAGAAADTMNITVGENATFAPGGTAFLTSSLVAVMATTTKFEGMMLTFQWQWTLSTLSGTTSSAWNSSNVGGCPSATFWPAPYVQIVQEWNTTGPPGAEYGAAVAGFISSQYFLLELETPTGHVDYAHNQTAPPGNSTPFNVTIFYDCWCGKTLPSGNYLVHIHNAMGSLLYVVPVVIGTGAPLVASATATPTSGTAPLQVHFSGSAVGGVSPYAYAWDFGDGGTSAAAFPVHVFGSGNYTVTLTVTDSFGVTNSTALLISVNAPPIPPLNVSISAKPTSGIAPVAVAFSHQIAGGVSPYVLQWSFGDGATSNASYPIHTYTTGGAFTAMLIVTDAMRTAARASLVISVAGSSGGPPSGHGPNFTVAFVESGLPAGAGWSVSIGTKVAAGSTSELVAALPNGTYSFHVVPVPGYTASPQDGTITVAGAAQQQTISFAASGSTGVITSSVPVVYWYLGAGAVIVGVAVVLLARARPPTAT
jgi:PKD repeat protein